MSGDGVVKGLALLLALLVGGYGYWNYNRNIDFEAREYRPYQGYSVADLQALGDAYRQEIGSMEPAYDRASSRRTQVRDDPFLGERVAEFERVQRVSAQKRGLGGDLAERKATVELIEAEIARRDGAGAWMVLLRRAFVYRAA